MGVEMRSDEDPAMCITRTNDPNLQNMNIWQHLSLNFLKNILGKGEDPDSSRPVMMIPTMATPRPEPIPPRQRSSLTRGLARYGPWGYLMLGMLICGAALLVCGLWGKYFDLKLKIKVVSNEFFLTNRMLLSS